MHTYGYSFYIHDVYNNQRHGKHYDLHKNNIIHNRINVKKYEEGTKNDNRRCNARILPKSY